MPDFSRHPLSLSLLVAPLLLSDVDMHTLLNRSYYSGVFVPQNKLPRFCLHFHFVRRNIHICLTNYGTNLNGL